MRRTSLLCSVLRLCAPNIGGTVSIPRWGTKMAHGVYHSPHKKRMREPIFPQPWWSNSDFFFLFLCASLISEKVAWCCLSLRSFEWDRFHMFNISFPVSHHWPNFWAYFALGLFYLLIFLELLCVFGKLALWSKNYKYFF